MNDTPRTDKESFYEGRAELVVADFARQLERENVALLEACETCAKYISQLQGPSAEQTPYMQKIRAVIKKASGSETKAKRLLERAHFFMNAQAYEQDDCEAFCRDLADFLGKPY